MFKLVSKMGILSLCVLLPLLAPAQKTAKKLTLCYDEWPPSTIFPTEQDPRRGFTIEMMQEIFTSRGYQIQYVQVPYARGIEMTRTGDCDLLAEVPEGKEKDVLFPREATFSYRHAFFIRKDDPWKFNGIASLKGRRLGNIVGYDYSSIDPEYEKYLNDPKNASQITAVGGDSAILQLMKMIALKRIDTYNEAYLVGSYVINQNGFKDQLTVGGFFRKPLVEKPAFSPRNPESKKLMKIWDQERKKMAQQKKDIFYLNKYGLKSID